MVRRSGLTLSLILIVSGSCTPVRFLTSRCAAEEQPSAKTTRPLPELAELAPTSSFALAEWINAKLEREWSEQKASPETCDDATFCRRAHLDLIGRIPGVSELRDFLAEEGTDKRSRLVDRLTVSDEDASRSAPAHAEHVARVWRRILLPTGTPGAAMSGQLEPWLIGEFEKNVGFDQVTREIVTAAPTPVAGNLPIQQRQPPSGAYVFSVAVGGQPENMADHVSRVFLGTRIGCAQCHDHPFAAWKKSDFWGMAAFFQGAARPMPNAAGATPELPEAIDALLAILGNGVSYQPKFLGGEPAKKQPGKSSRVLLAEWITAKENPQFAATIVNRTWQQMCGRGLIPAVDDLDQADAKERSRLLDELAVLYTRAGFDHRWLVQGIAKSRAYQLAQLAEEAQEQPLWMGQRPLKALGPDQMFDSMEQALLLPITKGDREAARHNGLRGTILARLDESAGRTPEDYTAGIPQVLLLMNGPLTATATELKDSRTLRAVVEAPFLSTQLKLETLFLATVSRRPTAAEEEKLLEFLKTHPDSDAWGTVFWALLNSPEFALSR